MKVKELNIKNYKDYKNFCIFFEVICKQGDFKKIRELIGQYLLNKYGLEYLGYRHNYYLWRFYFVMCVKGFEKTFCIDFDKDKKFLRCYWEVKK